MQVAIDGPAASGKSTAAKILACRLNFLYIDTGAMYRAVTLEGIRRGIFFENDGEIVKTARTMSLDVRQDWTTDRGFRVFIGDEDVTSHLFTPDVDAHVSTTARIPEVRRLMVELQRRMAKGRDIVMAGRDIGSNVLTNAEVKIFLTAAPEVRATRRQQELRQKGVETSYQEILDNLKHRDFIDSTRKDSPLVKTADAVEVDCSNLTIEEMADVIERVVVEKKGAIEEY